MDVLERNKDAILEVYPREDVFREIYDSLNMYSGNPMLISLSDAWLMHHIREISKHLSAIDPGGKQEFDDFFNL